MVGPVDYTAAGLSERAETQVADFMRRVYAWMCVGLLVTAAVAWLTASTPPVVELLATNRLVFWGIVIAELALVWYTTARIDVLAPATAGGLFLLYSALNGVTLSFILLAFTGAKLAGAFAISAGMFAGMAIFGYVTRRSLEGLGQFAFMGLIGLIVASVVNWFLKSDALNFVLSVVGVIVFAGLTAWDMQRLKRMALATEAGPTASFAVVGALSLYLDFINLFLSILRFTDRR
jgi:FtsH-binding integral membrane protein